MNALSCGMSYVPRIFTVSLSLCVFFLSSAFSICCFVHNYVWNWSSRLDIVIVAWFIVCIGRLFAFNESIKHFVANRPVLLLTNLFSTGSKQYIDLLYVICFFLHFDLSFVFLSLHCKCNAPLCFTHILLQAFLCIIYY